jgi:plasmid maintenance system antidote protein VapI
MITVTPLHPPIISPTYGKLKRQKDAEKANPKPKQKMRMFEKNCEICGKPFRRSAYPDRPPRFCGQDCLSEWRTGKRYEKYIIPEEWYPKIKEMYAKGVGMGQVKRMAKQIGVPRTKITNIARSKGWIPKSCNADYYWCDREIEIIEQTGRYHPKAVKERLKREGFIRTISAIECKRTQLNAVEKCKKNYSAHTLAECIGVDAHKINNAIKAGKIKAKRRSTFEGEKTAWDITQQQAKEYIINYLPEINIAYCDKYWLVDLLSNKYADKI